MGQKMKFLKSKNSSLKAIPDRAIEVKLVL